MLHGTGIRDNTKSPLDQALQPSNKMWMKIVEALEVIIVIKTNCKTVAREREQEPAI